MLPLLSPWPNNPLFPLFQNILVLDFSFPQPNVGRPRSSPGLLQEPSTYSLSIQILPDCPLPAFQIQLLPWHRAPCMTRPLLFLWVSSPTRSFSYLSQVTPGVLNPRVPGWFQPQCLSLTALPSPLPSFQSRSAFRRSGSTGPSGKHSLTMSSQNLSSLFL